ncbi:MAG TPA: phosphotransferase [Bryobacteraceae bacterium]|nr:phosphotransferase [Bryobacteraceae bacterium]HOQ46967.1 phosphotransferase [Bryobacteraceae bacterium]HPQ14992.1 phosphotransferase [Bryobacteraceae bacterium]HPU73106.1 phosphotransferase [Bryobacteraceae bacterium]
MNNLAKGGRTPVDVRRLTAFAARHYGQDPGRLRITVQELRGGLCASVMRARVRFLDPERRPRTAVFVIKRVAGGDIRELGAYRSLAGSPCARIAPQLLGAEQTRSGCVNLYLEYIPSFHPWPWADVKASELVLKRLATVHEALAPEKVPEWDYDAELQESAGTTLEILEEAALLADFTPVRRFLPSVRRLAAALPALRAQLVNRRWPRVALHGDAHTGNAIIRRQGRSHSAVLLDWSRIRLGSALEDVCSWLQSISFWEPEPKRRHDTLFRKYLTSRGMPDELTPELRELYWLAGASNAFAGALRYHVVRMGSAATRAERTMASAAVRDWLRILARADACWS